MKKNILILFLAFQYGYAFGQKVNRFVYYRCVPFRTSSPAQILENDFAQMKLPRAMIKKGIIHEKKIYGLGITKSADLFFKNLIARKKMKLKEYDIRMMISVRQEDYFINWDKKYIINNHNFYQIDSTDFENLTKLLKCKCY